MTALASLLALVGFACLALAMDRHFGEIMRRRLRSDTKRWFRRVGTLALCLSYAAAIMGWGAVMGTITWTGLVSVVAAMVLLTVSHLCAREQRRKRPR